MWCLINQELLVTNQSQKMLELNIDAVWEKLLANWQNYHATEKKNKENFYSLTQGRSQITFSGGVVITYS